MKTLKPVKPLDSTILQSFNDNYAIAGYDITKLSIKKLNEYRLWLNGKNAVEMQSNTESGKAGIIVNTVIDWHIANKF